MHAYTHINVKRSLLNTQPGDIYKARGCGVSRASLELILVVIEGKYSLENGNLECMLNNRLFERESGKLHVNIFFVHFLRFHISLTLKNIHCWYNGI